MVSNAPDCSGQVSSAPEGPLYVHVKASAIAALEAECAALRRQHREERIERLAAEERATSLQMRVDALNIAVADWRERAAGSQRATDNVRADWQSLRDTLREVRTILGATSEEPVVEAARRVVVQRDGERTDCVRAEVYQMRASKLNADIYGVRDILGATHGESVLEAARRVIAERNIAARARDVNARVAQEARDRADAAEHLAHEAEAQREAAVRILRKRDATIDALRRSHDDARAKLARVAEAQRQIEDNAAPLDLSGVRIDHVDVPVRRVGWSAPHNLPLPAYAKPGDAGLDLRARVDPEEPLWIKSGERAVVPCGFAFAIPDGYEGQVRPRSGMSRDGIVASLGTIDSGYRGEVAVILTNTNREAFPVRLGDRIAQLVIAPIARATLREVDALDETERGAGDFGHTGRA